MIPAVPSASYFADGFVMTSTFSIPSAGNDRKASATFPAIIPLGRPLISTFKFRLPRIETLPSISTSTIGTFANKSDAEPPFDVISWAAL